jgi:sensor histidine kinase YesM
LSDLLRTFLDERPRQEIPLREELAFVERYLAVEQLRFPDRLKVHVVADPAALEAYVPNLVLQPLVENALKHGIARRASAGHLEITAESDPETLVLTVSDDGPGPEPARGGNRSGIGLGNLRERLLRLYGPGERLSLVRGPGGGAVATLRLPYRKGPA